MVPAVHDDFSPLIIFFVMSDMQAIRTGWVHPNINLENPEKGMVCYFFWLSIFSLSYDCAQLHKEQLR